MESDSDQGEELRSENPSTLDFNRMKNTITASGYREGAGAGKEAGFQTGFDKGFAEGFKTGYALGMHNGIVETLKGNPYDKSSNEIEVKAFNQSRHGLCQICKLSSNQTSSLPGGTSGSTVENAISNQKEINRLSLQDSKAIICDHLLKADLSDLVHTINKTFSND